MEQFWRLPALPGAHSCNGAHHAMGGQGKTTTGGRTGTVYYINPKVKPVPPAVADRTDDRPSVGSVGSVPGPEAPLALAA